MRLIAFWLCTLYIIPAAKIKIGRNKPDKMILDIKKITTNDIAAVALLFDAYREFYGKPSDLQAAFDFLEQRISTNQSIIYLAILRGEPVGFVQLYPIFSSVQLKKAWLLNDLFVAPQARNQGVAEALLQQAKQLGADTKAAFLLLQTASDNYKAQSVYEKNGWVKAEDFFYEYAV
jgi:ribosomal protein S18 acetylase RimI-like enzyme